MGCVLKNSPMVQRTSLSRAFDKDACRWSMSNTYVLYTWNYTWQMDGNYTVFFTSLLLEVKNFIRVLTWNSILDFFFFFFKWYFVLREFFFLIQKLSIFCMWRLLWGGSYGKISLFSYFFLLYRRSSSRTHNIYIPFLSVKYKDQNINQYEVLLPSKSIIHLDTIYSCVNPIKLHLSLTLHHILSFTL